MGRYILNDDVTAEVTNDDIIVVDLTSTDVTSPFVCCDCGLTHLYLFQLRGKKLYLRCLRSDVLTDQIRRSAARHAHTQQWRRTYEAEWRRLGLDKPEDPRREGDG